MDSKSKVLIVSKNPELTKDPNTYRRDLVYNWVYSLPSKQVNEIQELENMIAFLKGTLDDSMYQKYLRGNFKLSPADFAHLRLMKELLIDLNKLKYGEKRTNLHVGVTYETVQDMIMKDGPDTTSN